VVCADAEHVYMTVVTSRPVVRRDNVPIIPSLVHEKGPDPVSTIPPNALLSPAYVSFTHIIRGRPVVFENGQWRRALVPGPKGARVQRLDNTSPLAISLSAKDISYLHQCHRNFWAGVEDENGAEQPDHWGGKGNGPSPDGGNFASAARSEGDGTMSGPVSGGEVSRASGHGGAAE